MSHTPSTPTVIPPDSATNPRFSTSGILNAQLKEKNRQGLLSNYTGRTGANYDINKFADKKTIARDPSAVPVLEAFAKRYAKATGPMMAGDGNLFQKLKTGMTERKKGANLVQEFAKQYNVDIPTQDAVYQKGHSAEAFQNIEKAVTNTVAAQKKIKKTA